MDRELSSGGGADLYQDVSGSNVKHCPQNSKAGARVNTVRMVLLGNNGLRQ